MSNVKDNSINQSRSDRGSMPLGYGEEPKFDKGVSWVGKNRWLILLIGSSFFVSLIYMVTFVAPKVFT